MKSFDTLMNDSQDVIFSQLKNDSTVSYRKKASSVVRSGLAALVEYDSGAGQPRPNLPAGTSRVLVTLKNDATLGISLEDDHPVIGDSIWVAPAPKVTAKWCTIIKRVEADHNQVVWEVR